MDDKQFLNPALTIHYIVQEIKVPVRELSVLIDHQLGKHFYDFINTYGIKQAMEILYEVSFNPKSSLNMWPIIKVNYPNHS